MKRKNRQASVLPRRRGIASIAVILIMVGVSMAFAVLIGIQDNLGGLIGFNYIQITRVSAYTDGDRLVITGDVKNMGSRALSSIVIDKISAGDLLITQNPTVDGGTIVDGHGDMTLSGVTDDGSDLATDTVDYGDAVTATTTTGTLNWAAIAAGSADQFYFYDSVTPTTGVATVAITGLSTDEDNLEGLTAGSSSLFRIVVKGISVGGHADVLDILKTVPSGSELVITLIGTDSQTSTTSEPRTTQVKAR